MDQIKASGQMRLPIDVFRAELDRNFDQGGRSFYFFDFDDNVVHLPTPIVLFNKRDNSERLVPTAEYAEVHPLIGTPGEWEDYEVRFDPVRGSYRNFREQPHLDMEEQPLIRDLKTALSEPFTEWRGPSWDFFVHAVNNNRPIAVITARGHHPHTIKRAINMMVYSRDLLASPNYLSVYPVSNPETRRSLGDAQETWSVAELKKAAIKAAVNDAFACYGKSPHHRFGMSDDDPVNVALIAQAMRELKAEHPDNAFFVFNTSGRHLVREEISGTSPEAGADENERTEHLKDKSQLLLF